MIMTNVIAHIVGLDDIHKKKIFKKLPKNIKAIDLDEIQQTIYNHPDITKQKNIWTDLSKELLVLQKQKKLILTKNDVCRNIDNKIKDLQNKRNQTKQTIHDIWKDNMKKVIDDKLNDYYKYDILFVGYNIFPKDFRIKINLPLPSIPNISKMSSLIYTNKIIYDIKPELYASNQIKYYLRAYTDKIIRGTFPLDLLRIDYLVDRYDKCSTYYGNCGYVPMDEKQIFNTLNHIKKNINNVSQINKIYVPTIFRSGDILPVNANKPIEGFISKEAAIENIRKNINPNTAIFIYEVNPEQFHFVDGKYITNKTIYPYNEESVLLS